MANLELLQRDLGHPFRDLSLLEQALTHPSMSHEQGGPVPHNQRLEFLGDAVLQLVLTRFLYDSFPDLGEGPLTKGRAQLVNRATLAEQGRVLRLGEHLALSRGEEMNGGRTRASALADAFEAVLGAIFLDGGYEAADAFLLRQFRTRFGELKVLPSLENPKGELQELLQAECPEPVRYKLASAEGPDHDRLFECTAEHKGVEIGRGKGKSKKEAESRAAMAALNALRSKS